MNVLTIQAIAKRIVAATAIPREQATQLNGAQRQIVYHDAPCMLAELQRLQVEVRELKTEVARLHAEAT